MALSERVLSDDGAFEWLLWTLDSRLREWWKLHPDCHTAIGKYYEDVPAMMSYEARQVVAVPGREELLSMALDALGPIAGKPILEVCSGSGAGALRLAQRGAIAVASDAFPILSVHADQLEHTGVHVLRDLEQGDLRGTSWCKPQTYQHLLGSDVRGFAGILGFMGLPLVENRASAYRGMHALLETGGRISILHDPEIPGRPLPTSVQTVRGIVDALKLQGRTKSPLEITATLLMRRAILHGEYRKTLEQEIELIETTFGNCSIARHDTYPEWVLFSATKA